MHRPLDFGPRRFSGALVSVVTIGVSDTRQEVGGTDDEFAVRFFGVRGSTSCHGSDVARYGGNTSCVAVDVPGHQPIMFDIGTGARYFGAEFSRADVFHGTCLLSHAHWDHIQGLPFFPPLLCRPDSTLAVYAPVQEDGTTVGDVVKQMLRPPLFPVGLDDFPGTVTFHSLLNDDFAIGDLKVMSRLIPHLGNTCGYRLDWNGLSVAYLSDHQQPGIDVYTTTDNVRELCDGVDLLIHDAQYTRREFEQRSNWGHCTVDYAVWVAQECGARGVALFHHDPTHTDDAIDELTAAAQSAGGEVNVIAAREGLRVVVG